MFRPRSMHDKMDGIYIDKETSFKESTTQYSTSSGRSRERQAGWRAFSQLPHAQGINDQGHRGRRPGETTSTRSGRSRMPNACWMKLRGNSKKERLIMQNSAAGKPQRTSPRPTGGRQTGQQPRPPPSGARDGIPSEDKARRHRLGQARAAVGRQGRNGDTQRGNTGGLGQGRRGSPLCGQPRIS